MSADSNKRLSPNRSKSMCRPMTKCLCPKWSIYSWVSWRCELWKHAFFSKRIKICVNQVYWRQNPPWLSGKGDNKLKVRNLGYKRQPNFDDIFKESNQRLWCWLEMRWYWDARKFMRRSSKMSMGTKVLEPPSYYIQPVRSSRHAEKIQKFCILQKWISSQ